MLLVTESVLSIKEQVRAPKGNNQAAVAPDRHDLARVLEVNHGYWNSHAVPVWIRELRLKARQQLIPVVRDYMGSYLPESQCHLHEGVHNERWILGGHQPELFHPGVWFKNILVHKIARETGSIGLHAIVDHDLARSTAIRVPRRSQQQPLMHIETVPLPLTCPESTEPLLPWNAWKIDHAKILDAAKSTEEALRSVGITGSLASEFFRQLADTSNDLDAALAFSQVRHRIERSHGIENAEFPISAMCRTDAWNQFVIYCLKHAVELNAIYNDCLEEYRQHEGITNPTQPVPRLGLTEKWVELPFWFRLPNQQTRRRAWVSRDPSNWGMVTDDPLDAAQSIDITQPNITRPGSEGAWCVLPRALTTTLFLRTFVADLFIHGIGGGQYDRLTDQIIQRFLNITPPQFVICTATLWLDFSDSSSSESARLQREFEKLEHDRQRLRSSPESFLDPQDAIQRGLASEHQRLLESIPPRGQKKEWHRVMKRLKSQIALAIGAERRSWEERKFVLEANAIEQRIRTSREFSFVLFNEQDVLERLHRLAQ
jgi:hypothetical protein